MKERNADTTNVSPQMLTDVSEEYVSSIVKVEE
jgi:hypothetical protein